MLEVIIASIGYAGGIVANKLVLARQKVPVMRFIPLHFVWLAVITAIFLPRFGGIVNPELLGEWSYRLLFVLMIAVAATWNIFYHQGIQKESLAEFELIMLFSPMATMIFAGIFLPAERDWVVFGAGLVSSAALFISRFRKHHVRVSRTAKRTIFAMSLLSFEAVLLRYLLDVFTPVTLYFLRTAVIAIVFIVYYKPKMLAVSRNAYALTIISAIFGVMQMVLKYYGYASLGIVETTMILLLGPFLVYIASYFYFNERLYRRDVLAAIIVVLSILYVQFGR